VVPPKNKQHKNYGDWHPHTQCIQKISGKLGVWLVGCLLCISEKTQLTNYWNWRSYS